MRVLQDMAELPPIDQHLEKEHQEKTKVKNIQCVEMGKFEVSNTVPLYASDPISTGPIWLRPETLAFPAPSSTTVLRGTSW